MRFPTPPATATRSTGVLSNPTDPNTPVCLPTSEMLSLCH